MLGRLAEDSQVRRLYPSWLAYEFFLQPTQPCGHHLELQVASMRVGPPGLPPAPSNVRAQHACCRIVQNLIRISHHRIAGPASRTVIFPAGSFFQRAHDVGASDDAGQPALLSQMNTP